MSYKVIASRTVTYAGPRGTRTADWSPDRAYPTLQEAMCAAIETIDALRDTATSDRNERRHRRMSSPFERHDVEIVNQDTGHIVHPTQAQWRWASDHTRMVPRDPSIDYGTPDPRAPWPGAEETEGTP